MKKTLPPYLRDKALLALRQIAAWNDAVALMRQWEERDGCPGLYEHELYVRHAWDALHDGAYYGTQDLETLETAMRAKGWSVDDFYDALGTPKLVRTDKGPLVDTYQEAQR